MRTSKLRCGCEYALGERERWVRLCPAHQAEWDETHGRWAAEQGAHGLRFRGLAAAASLKRAVSGRSTRSRSGFPRFCSPRDHGPGPDSIGPKSGRMQSALYRQWSQILHGKPPDCAVASADNRCVCKRGRSLAWRIVRLENRQRRKPFEGSNPSLSAKLFLC